MIKIPRNNILSKLWWFATNTGEYRADTWFDDTVNSWIDNKQLILMPSKEWFKVTSKSYLELSTDGRYLRKDHIELAHIRINLFTSRRLDCYRYQIVEEQSEDFWKQSDNKAKQLIKNS